MLILAEKELRQVLKMADVIEAVEGGFRALARGDAAVPTRLHLEIPESRGVLLDMPSRARLDGETVVGTKTVTVFENNSARNLDSVQAVYLLIDGETGAPLALMEGRFITAIRTAATSALATRLLASGEKKRLGVFGAGVQARFHIEAMLEVAEVVMIMIASRNETKAAALRESVTSLYNISCDVVPPEHAASKANLICTCTSSPAPLFDGALIQPGTHVNAVGAFTPAARELDSEAIRRARVFVDAEEAAGQEAGDLLIPIAEGGIDPSHIKGTLAELVAGKVPGRISPEEITIFKSTGVAIEDLVTARLAYKKALALGVGASVQL
ncbi:MAG TPA: ornithine cyclodeaminase family protein [Blastocatellia bacterium]|nr:ornithine cyclodeaminase family protein [Blastocatellia bacterium]